MNLPALLGAAAAGSLALGVIAELVARRLLVQRDRWFVHRPFARRDLHVSREALPRLDPIATFRANRDGERGDPVPPAGTERWIVAGGSAAECYYLDQDAAWSAVLQRDLTERRGRRVHVGNVARSLIPTRTIAALLHRSLRHFEGLDGIVLMVGASDLVAWLERDTPAELPAPAPIEELDVSAYAEENPTGTFRWTHPKALALYRVARRTAARLSSSVQVRENAGASIAKHRARRAAATRLVDEVPDRTGLLDAYRRDLGVLIEVCRSFAPRVVLVRQPWLEREFTPDEAAELWNFGNRSPYRGEIDHYFTHRLISELMSDIDRVTDEVARDLHVESIGLRDVVPTDFEHYYDFLHNTPRGAEVVGRALGAHIANGGAADGGSPAGVEAGRTRPA
ncbi:MAG: hypothetical protein AAFZ87_03450 [Planctomycetota bacterium]